MQAPASILVSAAGVVPMRGQRGAVEKLVENDALPLRKPSFHQVDATLGEIRRPIQLAGKAVDGAQKL